MLTINDVSKTVGSSGYTPFTFTITRGESTTGISTVEWATANDTAYAGTDFVGVPPTEVTFAPGVSAIPVTVEVKGGSHGGSLFFVELTSPVGAGIVDNIGTGQILQPGQTGALLPKRHHHHKRHKHHKHHKKHHA
jgi:hypothetical protein